MHGILATNKYTEDPGLETRLRWPKPGFAPNCHAPALGEWDGWANICSIFIIYVAYIYQHLYQVYHDKSGGQYHIPSSMNRTIA